MRILVVVVAVAGCGSGAAPQTGEPGRAPAEPPGVAEPVARSAADPLANPLRHCERTVAGIDALLACAPELRPALESMRGFLAERNDAGKLDTLFPDEHERMYAARTFGAECAYFVVAVAKDPPTTTCAVFDAALVAESKAYLEAHLAARAPVGTTGDAPSDESLRQVAAIRDKVCACTTMECARTAADEMIDNVKPLSKSSPASAQRMLSGLLHDISKCGAEQRFLR